MKRLFAKAVMITSITLALLMAGAGPALASNVVTASSASAATAVQPHAVLPAESTVDKSDQYLSTIRWRDAAAQLHGRYDQFLQTDVIAASSRILNQQAGLGFGNLVYYVAQNTVTMAMHMKPLDLMGEKADEAAADIGKALFGKEGGATGGFVGIIVIIVIGTTIFQMRRAGPKPWKKILTLTGIIALFFLMINGANDSKTTGGEFEPGFMSPGWFAVTISETVSTVATVASDGFLTITPGDGSLAAAEGTGCARYMANMNKAYIDAKGDPTRRVVSSLWESSGLSIWKQTQYGSSVYNTTQAQYGDNVFCHQLDWQAGVSPLDQAIMTFGSEDAADDAKWTKNSTAWGASDNNERDRSLVAWAACDIGDKGKMVVRPGFAPKMSVTACERWFTESWARGVTTEDFNVGGAADDVYDNTVAGAEGDASRKFLWTLHGNDVNSGLILVGAYAVCSLLVAAVFVGFGAAIALAKLAAIAMMVTVFFVMLLSVVNGNTSKLLGFLKMYFGFTILAFGATVILALISLLSKLISEMGVSLFGAGELMSIVWTGFSPLIGIVLLHLIFTKVLKMPSVFTPSSAMAWGAAGGSIGGVAGGRALQSLERRGARRAKGLAVGGLKKVGNAALGRTNSTSANVLKRKGALGAADMPKKAAGATATAGRHGTPMPGSTGETPNGSRNAASSADVYTAAETAASIAGGKMKGKDRRNAVMGKGAIRDARLFAKGMDPNKVPEGGLNRAAYIAGGNVRHLRSQRALNRERAANNTSSAGRADAKARAAAARAATRSAAATAKSADAAFLARGSLGGGRLRNAFGSASESLHTLGAATGRNAKAGAQASARAAWAGTKATGRATKAIAQDKRFQAGAKSAARIGAATLAGAFIAGPAGAAVGFAGTARKEVRHGIQAANAQKVLAYAGHIEEQNGQKPTSPTPQTNAAPAQSRQSKRPDPERESPAHQDAAPKRETSTKPQSAASERDASPKPRREAVPAQSGPTKMPATESKVPAPSRQKSPMPHREAVPAHVANPFR